MDVAGHAVSVPGVVLLGIVVGLAAGMFGVGGGFLLTPLLSVFFGVPLPIAVGTGMCQMVGTALAALIRHRKLGQGERRFEILMLAGSLLGVTAGASTVVALHAAGVVDVGGSRLPLVTLVLGLSFIVFLLASATVFWRQGRHGVEDLEYVRRGPLARVALPPLVDLPAVPLSRVSAPLVAYVGLGLGFVSGLLGVGGGVAMMPLLVYGFGFPIRQAAGTGIALVMVTAAAGTLVHARAGNVDLGLAMLLLVGSSVSAQVGAGLTRRLPARTLRRIFAAIVVATSIAVAWDLVRKLGWL
jgi:hypothetical protein